MLAMTSELTEMRRAHWASREAEQRVQRAIKDEKVTAEWDCGMGLRNWTAEWDCGMGLRNGTAGWDCGMGLRNDTAE